MKLLVFTAIVACLAAIVFPTAPVEAAIIEFLDEDAFLDHLHSMSAEVVSEGFESDPWEATRTGVSRPFTVNGMTWVARQRLSTVNTYSDWVHSGAYAVYNSRGWPDSITVFSENHDKIVAAGGWFATVAADTIEVRAAGRTIGLLDLKEDRPHHFFGVVDASGLSAVTFVSTTGQWGADDFTIAVVPEPATLALLAVSASAILLGIGGGRRAWG